MFSLPKDSRAASRGKRIRRGRELQKVFFFVFYEKYQCVNLVYCLFFGSVSGEEERARQDADMSVENSGPVGRRGQGKRRAAEKISPACGLPGMRVRS
ncbi:hypothetical protein [uncultured Desulfovibrio sp.]|uniref:hypothetical protein n=1 Tax=uncultured Desulfovibrio sp. TaxID=167968 RepID=UPI00260FDB61|nr:hypothetical protein [uncultured Desulfovibrio sp.]